MRVWTQANFDEEGEKRLRRNSFAKSQLSARPGTAPDPNKGMMTTSASLPRLPGAQRSPIVASPSATNSLAQISGSSAIVRNGSPRSPFPPGVDNPYEAESVADVNSVVSELDSDTGTQYAETILTQDPSIMLME